MKKIILKYKSFPVQVKASFWFLICSFLQKGISMITTPIFTRLLSTAEYGEFNVFNSWYSIAFIFVSLSLSSGVYTQGLVKYDRQRKIFSSSLQGLTLTLVVLWTVIYLVFKEFWNNLFSMSTTLMSCNVSNDLDIIRIWVLGSRTKSKLQISCLSGDYISCFDCKTSVRNFISYSFG